MKKTLRRICSFMLVIAMVLALCPSFLQNVYAEEGDVTSPDPDAVVIASTSYDDGDAYNQYIWHQDLFYEVAAQVLGAYDTADAVESAVNAKTVVRITYGDVKNITKFVVAEDSKLTSLYGLSTYLPNMDSIEISSALIGENELYNMFDSQDCLPDLMKHITIKAHSADDDSEYPQRCRVEISNSCMDRFTELETLDIDVDECYFYYGDESEFSFPAKLKNLSLAQSKADNIDYDDEYLEKVASAVSKLTNLQSLNLSGQKFADRVDYTQFANLNALYLNNCDIKTFPDLSGMKNLVTLSIAGNDNVAKSVALKRVPASFANDETWVKTNFTDANEVVTTGDKTSDYYISDQNLYARLLESGDRNGDGVLTVGEAASISSLDTSSEIKSYEGLAKAAPNINSIWGYGIKADVWDDFYNEVENLNNITDFNTYIHNQGQFDDIVKMTTLTNLGITCEQMESLDMSELSKLAELESLSLYHSSYAIDKQMTITGIDAINSLTKLTSLRVDKAVTVTNLSDTLLGQLRTIRAYIMSSDDLGKISAFTNVNTIELTFDGDTEYSVDLSGMNTLYDIVLSGNLTEVTLPENTSSSWRVDIRSDISNAEIRNLDKYADKLDNLTLTGCDIGDFSVIGKFTALTSLTLDNCNLKDTTGLGNLTRLDDLRIRYNYDLTSIDSEISRLVELKWLDLSYNGLEELPDLSALCTSKGLLSDGNYMGAVKDRVNLCGNNLTEEAVKASNLSDKFLGDANWMAESTTRKYFSNGNVGMYYTNLTSTNIYSKLVNYTNVFYTDGDVTLNSELVQYIKEKEGYLYVKILNVDDNGTVNGEVDYNITSYTLNDWSSGDIVLSKIDFTYADDAGAYKELFSGDVYGSLVMPEDVVISPYVNANARISAAVADGTYYSEYVVDSNNIVKKTYTYLYVSNGYININIKNNYKAFILASTDARIYNNMPGVYCEGQMLPISNFSIVASGSYVNSQWVENDWKDKLTALVDASASGTTIEMAATSGNCMLSKEMIEKLNAKKIKLVVYTGWQASADYLEVHLVRTIDFENVTNESYVSLYNFGFNFYEYDASVMPDALFNGLKKTSFSNNVDASMKAYVGGQFVNGETLYLYKVDYSKCEISLVDECTVNYGCVEFDTSKNTTYFLTNGQPEKTTWENSTPVNPDPATGGNAKPDKPDTGDSKCKDGHTWETKIITEATCTEAGTGIRTCSVCGTQEEYEIPATGHIWNSVYTVDKAASATEDGSKSLYCSVCGTLKPDSTVVIEKYGTEISLPTIDAAEVTSETGVKSAPLIMEQEKIEKKSEAVSKLIDKMSQTIAPSVDVYTTGVVPTMTGDLFSAAVTNNKDITLGAVNENNQLIYSWTFDYDTIDTDKVPEGGLDLAITFATDKQKEIEDITGQSNAVYISIEGYHGELPGPAKVKTYVGNQYKNGDVIYLYYYNEETGKVEVINGSGLVVTEGYVEYTLTHCSTYFVTEDDPSKYGLQTDPATPEDTPQATPAPAPQAPAQAAPTAKASPKTGDTTFPFIPAACFIAGLSLVGFAVSFRKKETL